MDSRVPKEIDDPHLSSYLSVVISFSEGLKRIWGAEAAYARLVCALISFNALGRPEVGEESPAAEVLQHLARVRRTSYESMTHVTDISHLVYATSLFDSFLSDTTVFLFLRIPLAMGKNQQISLQTLIEAPSKTEIVSQLATARAREIAYLPFAGRLQFLRDTFGLKFVVDDKTLAALSRYAAMRNASVHNQSILNLQLDEDGCVNATPRALERVTSDELHTAIDTYGKIAHAVYEAVFRQVLKSADNPRVSRYINSSHEGIGTTHNEPTP